MNINIGFIGLGKMGKPMAERLDRAGYNVVGYDQRNVDTDVKLAVNYENLSLSLPDPRLFWVMVNADRLDGVLGTLKQYLKKGDIIVDGGNSIYKEERRRAAMFENCGIYFLDAGTSGGLEGAVNGLNFTIGGNEEAFEGVKDVFEVLAKGKGYAYVGKSGNGVGIKMIHNAIEYAMIQAIAEGLSVMKEAFPDVDLEKVVKTWNSGALIRSNLLGLAGEVLGEYDPSKIEPVVGSAGRWVEDFVELALEKKVPVPAITASLYHRYYSRGGADFQGSFIATLREKFGGHTVEKKAD